MKRLIRTLVISLSVATFASSQSDAPFIPSTLDPNEHKSYWRMIYFRDQDLRNHPEIEKMDEENMFSIIDYYSQYGYPQVALYGNDCKIIQGVWGHIRSSRIRHHVFRIISDGWKKGEISDEWYRDQLRVLYQSRFEGNEYTTRSFDYLHHLLDVNEASIISIDSVQQFLKDLKLIRTDTNQILGEWRIQSTRDTHLFDGKVMVDKAENPRHIIYKTNSNTYYLKSDSPSNQIEPVQLIHADSTMKKFLIAGRISGSFYLIDADGNLYLKNSEHKTLKSFYVE